MGIHNVTLNTESNLTNTGYRQYWQAINDTFAAGGWVKSTETGEVNPATVTAPSWTGGAVLSDFQIWQMDDSLSGTAPIFIKWQWYRSNAGSLCPYFTIGKGSDGAGTITDVLLATALNAVNYGLSGNDVEDMIWYGSANDGNSMRFAFRPSALSKMSLVVIERAKNNSGGLLSGVHIMTRLPSASAQYGVCSRTVKYNETSPSPEHWNTLNGTGSCFPPSGQSTGLNSDNDTSIYPFFMYDIGRTMYPLLGACGIFTTDAVSAWTTQTISVYGEEITALVIPASGCNLARGNLGVPANSNLATFMRYE